MDESRSRLSIRTLTVDDFERLARIDEKYTGRRRSRWFSGKLKRALDDSDVCISLGAELDGVLVGAVLGNLHYGEFGLPEPVAVFDTILVDPAYERQGVASALVEHLVRNLKALRISILRTEVAWDEQKLIGFLARKQFRPAPRLVLELDLEAAATSEDELAEEMA